MVVAGSQRIPFVGVVHEREAFTCGYAQDGTKIFIVPTIIVVMIVVMYQGVRIRYGRKSFQILECDLVYGNGRIVTLAVHVEGSVIVGEHQRAFFQADHIIPGSRPFLTDGVDLYGVMSIPVLVVKSIITLDKFFAEDTIASCYIG